MKKIVLLALAAIVCQAAFSEGADAKGDTAQKPKKSFEERTGGFVTKKGSAKGFVSIVNAQKKVAKADIVAATEAIRKDARFQFVIEDVEIKQIPGKCVFADLKKAKNTPVLVAVVEDPAMPNVLCAPEDGWAVVNVAHLDEGLKTDGAKAKFVPERTRKEILRAFCYAAGGTGTQFPGNVLSVLTLSELDYCGEFIPMDAVQSVRQQLSKKGVVPERRETYMKACMQGWAPNPTNEFQKALWNKYMTD